MPGAILTNAASACMAPLSYLDERERLRREDLDVLPADPSAPITETERAYYDARPNAEREFALWALVIAQIAHDEGEVAAVQTANGLGLDTETLRGEFARQRRRGVGPRDVSRGKHALFPDVEQRPDLMSGVVGLADDKGYGLGFQSGG